MGYGEFSEDGREYVITDPRPPRPWANVIANPRMGLAVSQTGSGFSWIDNSQLGTLTVWQQDLARDSSGKFLYLRDAADGTAWSASPAPAWPAYDAYRCRHGFGFTAFETSCHGVKARWTLLVHPEATVELWLLELRETAGRARSLEVVPYLEWCLGVSPAPRREFHKLFLETGLDPDGTAWARNHMWDVGNARWGHWNTDFPYTAAFGASVAPSAALADKAAFLGPYGDPRAPRALGESSWPGLFGRHADPVTALRSVVPLPAGGTAEVAFALAASRDPEEARSLVREHGRPDAVRAALAATRAGWSARLAAHRMELPDARLGHVVNDWIRYQAIAARLWGRCGYYQQSGAFGFRDQLQDSQVWLTIDPERCRSQIALHAAHQFADGSVVHWWHPLTEQGHVTRMTDDLLWLAFVTASYVKETGRLDVLEMDAPFLDDGRPAPLREHVDRAFRRVFSRTSARGIPYIGAGDWNDGLSACGLAERGESVWLGHFLAGLLADWAEIRRRAGDAAGADDFEARRAALVAAVNAHGWDGAWYSRGTLDDGTVFGSSRNEEGRIFLNAQTWAVLNDVAPPDRAAACMEALRAHLVSEAGALLLAPAYRRPVQEIGYITRYAPGLRENGGVYTHAATWAIAAAAKVKDAALVDRLLRAIDPSGKDPDRYWAEPYVLPGNVDGPDSPLHGRAGWTWYTGSAAWLHRVVAEWVLGVRPTWDGLRVDPCLPPGWPGASMTRPWRGSTYRVTIGRGSRPEVTLDGRPLPGKTVPPPERAGGRHEIRAVVLPS